MQVSLYDRLKEKYKELIKWCPFYHFFFLGCAMYISQFFKNIYYLSPHQFIVLNDWKESNSFEKQITKVSCMHLYLSSGVRNIGFRY